MVRLLPLDGRLFEGSIPSTQTNFCKRILSMANEHYWKIIHRYTPATANQLPVTVPIMEFNDDQTGTEVQSGQLDIGTSEETITWSADIGDEKWLVLRNLDPTNYVQIGFSTGVYGIRLRAGDPMLIPLEPGTTIYALANTASCKVQYFVYEA